MCRKSLAGLGLLCVLVLLGFSAGMAGESVAVRVLEDDGQRTVVEVQVLDYLARPVWINGKEFSEILLPGEAVGLEAGAPNLPHVSRSLIIPDDAEMAVSVLSSTYADHPLAVAPSKGNLLRSVDPAAVPYVLGPVYLSAAFYPQALAAISEPFIFRDHRGVTLRVNPFQYNPATGTLRAFDKIVVEVRVAGPGTTNVLHRPAEGPRQVPAFTDIYRNRFINYGSRQDFFYPPIDEDGEMLIIAHDAWISNLNGFVSHKTGIGIPATVVGVSTIGNTASQIKSYIQNFYNTHNLAFVLLVGDVAQVATPMTSASGENGAADPTYALLAGSDHYPDILVGRFSAQNTTDLDTQVRRTIDYETLPATTQAWFKRGTGIGSAEGPGDDGQYDKDHIEAIRQLLLGDGYTLVDQIYDPGATDTQVSNALNAGRGVVNYCGHGSATSWGTTGFNNTDVNNLVNKDQLPFIVSVACNNGQFEDYDACFGEAWLRAQKDGRPTGAIAVYASSVSQSWNPPMEGQDEFNDLLTDTARPYWSFGALAFGGSSSMMEKYGQDGIEMFDTWIIFGDPSLRVVGQAAPATGLRVTPESGLSSTGPAGGPFAPLSQAFVLENLDPSPLSYAVTVDRPWLSVSSSRGTIAVGSTQTVTVSLAPGAQNLDLGTWTGTIGFVNESNHVGDTTRPVSLQIGSAVVVNQVPLDTDPGWSRQGQWQFGQPTGQGGLAGKFNPDPTSGATGPNVFGVNLAGNFNGTVGGPYTLTSAPFNLTGYQDVAVRFMRWLNTAGPRFVNTKVEVSANGTAWTEVFAADNPVAENAWTMKTLSLAGVADNQPAVQVRWSYQVHTAVKNPGSGWNIDDVQFTARLSTAKISLSVTPQELNWSAIPGATGYDVVRGDAGLLASTAGDFTAATQACLGNDLSGTSLAFGAAPGPGTAWWFLVRGLTSAGPLTYQDLDPSQVGARDAEIAASANTCM